MAASYRFFNHPTSHDSYLKDDKDDDHFLIWCRWGGNFIARGGFRTILTISTIYNKIAFIIIAYMRWRVVEGGRQWRVLTSQNNINGPFHQSELLIL